MLKPSVRGMLKPSVRGMTDAPDVGAGFQLLTPSGSARRLTAVGGDYKLTAVTTS